MKNIINLVKKDLITTLAFKRYISMVIAFCIGFAMLYPSFLSAVPFYLIVGFIIQVIAYEEKYKNQYFIGSLPVSKGEVVLAKYIEGVFWIIVGVLIMVVEHFILTNVFNPSGDIVPPVLTVLVMGVVMGAVGVAIFVPLNMVLGSVNSKIVLPIMMAAFVFFLMSLSSPENLLMVVNFINSNKDLLMVVGGVILIIFLVLSYFITSTLYEKKEIR